MIKFLALLLPLKAMRLMALMTAAFLTQFVYALYLLYLEERYGLHK